jgi:uncharacterized lipoprotein
MKQFKFTRLAALTAVLISISGCAVTPQQVFLNPEINVAGDTIGKGKTVYLQVLDERKDNHIGNRGVYKATSASITLDSVEDAIYQAVRSGLQKKGFDVTNKKDTDRELIIQVKNIRIKASTGLVTAGYHVNSSLKVKAKNKANNYDKSYKASDDRDVFFVPSASDNQKSIDRAVSASIEKLFKDKALLEFLAANK